MDINNIFKNKIKKIKSITNKVKIKNIFLMTIYHKKTNIYHLMIVHIQVIVN